MLSLIELRNCVAVNPRVRDTVRMLQLWNGSVFGGIQSHYCFVALAVMSLPMVAEHHHNICTRTFESIMSDMNHKLKKLLSPLYKSNYNLRRTRTFTLPRCKTNRFKNSFFMASGRIVNNFQVSYYTFLVLAITIITHFYNYQYKLLPLCKYAIQLMLQCI